MEKGGEFKACTAAAIRSLVGGGGWGKEELTIVTALITSRYKISSTKPKKREKGRANIQWCIPVQGWRSGLYPRRRHQCRQTPSLPYAIH